MKKLLLIIGFISLILVGSCSKGTSNKNDGSTDADKVVESDDEENKNDLDTEEDNDDSGWGPIDWL